MLAELEEVLNVEIGVDMKKLRKLAQRGVVADVRGSVWKLLLDISKADECIHPFNIH